MQKGIQKLSFSFDETSLTHFGGMFLFQRFCKKLRIKELLHKHAKFNHRLRYYPADLIIVVLFAIVAGILRLSGTRILHYNGSFQRFLGLQTFPNATNLTRFLLSITRKTLNGINKAHDHLRSSLIPKGCSSIILDIDSTVLTVYGTQEGSAIGFNPHKRGRPSYQPLLCFEGRSRDYWHGCFRSGNVGSSTNAIQFLDECFAKVPGHIYRIKVRADGGFYHKDVVEYLDDNNREYVIAAGIYSNARSIFPELRYTTFKAGYQTSEYRYKPQNWHKEHRFIVIRRPISETPSARSHLFEMDGYNYQLLITNLSLAPERIWHFYNDRWRAEQDIKELKENFTLSTVPSQHWNSNETYFNLLLFAYNIVNWFKRFCLPAQYARWSLKTLRTEIIVLPAKLVKTHNKNLLKLPQKYVHKKLFLDVAKKIESLFLETL